MTRIEEAVERFKEGNACSQAVFSTYSPLFGIEADKAMRISAGFAGGMRMAETCGAVTGAFMILGLKYCDGDGATIERRQATYQALLQFVDMFKERNDSVICKCLLGHDVSTPEGHEAAKAQDVFRTICPKLVGDAAEILETFLKV
jgi:C_GCAxxG_C_C family probable redox protein